MKRTPTGGNDVACDGSPLLPQHRHELEVGSGIHPDVIARRGYRSVTAAEVAALGYAPDQCRDGLLAQLWTLAGVPLNTLLKPIQPRTIDGKALKYEAPAGSIPHLDIHPDAQHVLRDPMMPLYFTEGVKKADAAWSRGLPCVALTGVYHFLRHKLVVPDLDEIALQGRLVRVVFDSDVTRKQSVADALLRFCEALRRRGARVEVVYLPEGPEGAKVGLDDFFVTGGTVAELEVLARPWDGKGPGIWQHYAGDQDPAELQTVNRLLMAAILNPEISRNDLMVMASVAGQVMHKQARGEVEPDGRVVLSAAEIADDYRPAPAKGERVAPVNPVTGTKPRMARERVGRYMGDAVERGLLRAKPLPTVRQHANGSTYKTTDWVIDPVDSFAELIDPWARYRQDQPKLRKPRTIPEACPECGEVHALRRRDYCTGCGALVDEKLIERPMPESSTTACDNLSEAETPTPTRPTEVRKVRQIIGAAPSDLIAPDMSCDELSEADLGIDAPPLHEAQEVLAAATLAPPDDARRALQDVEAQLARLAVQRGRTPVPKPGQNLVDQIPPWEQPSAWGAD
jgi:hypothetical protein